MDDTKIIELFWVRDEKAIEETASKYGRRFHHKDQSITLPIYLKFVDTLHLANWIGIMLKKEMHILWS